jgi:hypothetical protein
MTTDNEMWANVTTLEEDEKIVDEWVKGGSLAEWIEAETPNPDGTCKGCGGLVVCKATELFHGNIMYSQPVCEDCDRLYLCAENAPKVGAEEFLSDLHRPVTI